MKKQILIIGAILVVALFAFFATQNQEKIGVEDNNDAGFSEGAQTVKLSFQNGGYVLKPAILKKNIPVKMEVEMETVYGCMRDVRIPSFDVSKFVSEEDNVIYFTPTEEGEFDIACSMNMGRGKFKVE